jgi:hypothetical protein
MVKSDDEIRVEKGYAQPLHQLGFSSLRRGLVLRENRLPSL